MPIPITDKFKPKGVGGYALMDAEDIEMPDGTRLSGLEIPDVKDGVSPVIVITKIEGGHTITIKDATDTHSFNVMDGKDGQDASITIDSALSDSSENPVQNKVVNAALTALTNGFSNTLNHMVLPHLLPAVSESDNGKVLAVVNNQWEAADQPGGASITVDSALDANSENPVQNKVLTAMFNEATMVLQQLYAAIPTDAHINSLIDEKLGVIENGSY